MKLDFFCRTMIMSAVVFGTLKANAHMDINCYESENDHTYRLQDYYKDGSVMVARIGKGKNPENSVEPPGFFSEVPLKGGIERDKKLVRLKGTDEKGSLYEIVFHWKDSTGLSWKPEASLKIGNSKAPLKLVCEGSLSGAV